MHQKKSTVQQKKVGQVIVGIINFIILCFRVEHFNFK
jgi:hypothetical protein